MNIKRASALESILLDSVNIIYVWGQILGGGEQLPLADPQEAHHKLYCSPHDQKVIAIHAMIDDKSFCWFFINKHRAPSLKVRAKDYN